MEQRSVNVMVRAIHQQAQEVLCDAYTSPTKIAMASMICCLVDAGVAATEGAEQVYNPRVIYPSSSETLRTLAYQLADELWAAERQPQLMPLAPSDAEEVALSGDFEYLVYFDSELRLWADSPRARKEFSIINADAPARSDAASLIPPLPEG